MKKVFFGSAMLAVLLLAGCEKEQSQLTLDGMAGVAKVQGKVTYDAGFMVENGAVVMNPVAVKGGVDVVLEIAYSEYSAGAEGKKQYTTKTAEDGTYQFEIPVGLKAINATVEVLPFEAAYGTLVDGYEAANVISIEKAMFNQSSTKNVSLENAKVRTADLTVVTTSKFDYASLSNGKKVKIEGNVFVQSEDWLDKENITKTQVNKSLDAKVGQNVTVLLAVQNVTVSDAPMFIYSFQTVASDNTTKSYAFEVPVPDAWNLAAGDVSFDCTIADFYVEAENETLGYKHLYFDIDGDKGKTQYLAGVWSLAASPSATPSVLNTEVPLQMPSMKLLFEPRQDQAIYGVNKKDKGDMTGNYVSNNVYGWTLPSLD